MLHTHPLCVAERSSNMKMWFEIFLYRVRAVPGGHREDFADRERDSCTGRFPVKPDIRPFIQAIIDNGSKRTDLVLHDDRSRLSGNCGYIFGTAKADGKDVG